MKTTNYVNAFPKYRTLTLLKVIGRYLKGNLRVVLLLIMIKTILPTNTLMVIGAIIIIC